MQVPPRLYSEPPRYSASNTKKTLLIVLTSIAGAFLLCCVGGALLIWRAGFSDGLACYDLANKGRYREAIPHCRTLVQQIPRSSGAHNELGWCLALVGEGPESVDECRKAVELEPIRNHYDSLAMALAVSGKGEEALQIEKEHVIINGKLANASELVTLGMVYYSVGRKEDAH